MDVVVLLAAGIGTALATGLGAVVAYGLVEYVTELLPVSFGFAAGAMLSLVVLELPPKALARQRWMAGLAGTVIGAVLMLTFSAVLGV